MTVWSPGSTGWPGRITRPVRDHSSRRRQHDAGLFRDPAATADGLSGSVIPPPPKTALPSCSAIPPPPVTALPCSASRAGPAVLLGDPAAAGPAPVLLGDPAAAG